MGGPAGCREGIGSEIGHCSQGQAVGHRHMAPPVSFTKCSWLFSEQVFGERGLGALCHRAASLPGSVTAMSQDPGDCLRQTPEAL